MKYPFTFTVLGYDNKSEYLESGMGICESYADAAHILEKKYGDEIIAIKHMKLFEEDCVITLPTETLEEVLKVLNAYGDWSV